MEVVNELSNIYNIKLFVYGAVDNELFHKFGNQLTSNVKFLGWLSRQEIYELTLSADLAVFPGVHSVLWEETVGLGIPCMFKCLVGFEHLNHSNNCIFIDSTDKYTINNEIKRLLESHNQLSIMKKNAARASRDKFKYSKIVDEINSYYYSAT